MTPFPPNISSIDICKAIVGHIKRAPTQQVSKQIAFASHTHTHAGRPMTFDDRRWMHDTRTIVTQKTPPTDEMSNNKPHDNRPKQPTTRATPGFQQKDFTYFLIESFYFIISKTAKFIVCESTIPSNTFCNIFTLVKYIIISVKFCQFVANLYPHAYLPILINLS